MENIKPAPDDQEPDESGRPQETLPDGPVSSPEYTEDGNTAYLAYILREAELIRERADGISRKLSVVTSLLAVGILVLIIYWLDITGTLDFL